MLLALNGKLGTAYQCKQNTPLWQAAVSFYAVNLPSFHPMLQWFVVAACHLEPVAGLPTPVKINKTSTHEVLIAEIDPESYLFEPVDVSKIEKCKVISPTIFETQVDNLTNDEAAMLIDLLVADLLAGTLEPIHETKKKWFEATHRAQKWLSRS